MSTNRRWSSRNIARWEEFIDRLEDNCPVDREIRVRRMHPGSGLWAGTEDHGSYCLIQIRRDRSFDDALYDLCEEWAHCMSGWTGDEIEDHNDTWGIANAMCVREMLRFNAES